MQINDQKINKTTVDQSYHIKKCIINVLQQENLPNF